MAFFWAKTRQDGGVNYSGTLNLETTAILTQLRGLGVELGAIAVADELGSTNVELAHAVVADPDTWHAPALLAARHQSAGRGRLERNWITPANSALTFSLYLEPDLAPTAFTWVPLLVGTAVAEHLRGAYGVAAQVKWPNDVVVHTTAPNAPGWLGLRKLGGILVERVGERGLIVGVGLNVCQREGELPVASAISLELVGLEDAAGQTGHGNTLLAGMVAGIVENLGQLEAAHGDAHHAGLAARCLAASVTIGAQVRAELTDGRTVTGVAQALAPNGGLIVVGDDGVESVVTSGDVYHLRLN